MNELVVMRHLTKRYKGKEALSDFNVTIPAGKIIGLLGPNGSGKTTLIKLIAGLLVPTSGEVTIVGKHPGEESKALISYLPDRLTIPSWMKIRDYVTYFSDFYADFDRSRAEEMLGMLKIDAASKFSVLSKGTKEKVQLITAMARKAKLYLLDEPIAGVDPAARDYILKTILSNYDSTASILISTHLISDVENILDDVIFIREGHLDRYTQVDKLRDQKHASIDDVFREEFKC